MPRAKLSVSISLHDLWIKHNFCYKYEFKYKRKYESQTNDTVPSNAFCINISGNLVNKIQILLQLQVQIQLQMEKTNPNENMHQRSNCGPEENFAHQFLRKAAGG